ncbi:Laccase-1 [Ceratobasidium sp. 423]|nr:Laccase-1 [Ceratobasidium sp. 423]
MTRTTFLGSVSLFASAVLARTVEYNWKVINRSIAPDGVERNAVLVNGQYPGPLIYAKKGDTLKVKVHNKLTNNSMEISTTIHWHGLHEHRNADDDGPAFVTQCPITPEASYTYDIPLGDQTGTYWYHSHMSTQYIDGLRGPIVIYPDDPHKELYDIDNEKTVLTLGDWYHDSAKLIEASGNITRQRPDSATINGKGRFNSSIPANPDTLYTLKVKRGKRYRLRLINTSALASFMFSAQNHKLKVIAADAVPVKPYEVDSLEILAGQRYDCILEANQKPDTYWINAPLTNVPNKTTQALIVYEDDPRPFHPPSGPYRKWAVLEGILQYWQHHHGHHGSMSGYGDHKPRAIEMVTRSNPAQRQNNTSLTLDPSKLVILADKDGVTQSDFSTSEHTVILPKDECIEFNIKGISGLNITHPMHLHGHTFDVVQFGNNAPNYVNPPRRDVVGSTDQGVRIRFKTDNPGPWFLHCHIDWHLVEGFAMVFAEAPEAIKDGPQSVHVDPEWKGLCEKYDAWTNSTGQQ